MAKKDIVENGEEMVTKKEAFSPKDALKLMKGSGLSFKQIMAQSKKIKKDMEEAKKTAEEQGETFSEKEFFGQVIQNAKK